METTEGVQSASKPATASPNEGRTSLDRRLDALEARVASMEERLGVHTQAAFSMQDAAAALLKTMTSILGLLKEIGKRMERLERGQAEMLSNNHSVAAGRLHDSIATAKRMPSRRVAKKSVRKKKAS
ncbi:MAG: hypothetical protein C4326_10660 [Ignavibacteria bacterium]